MNRCFGRSHYLLHKDLGTLTCVKPFLHCKLSDNLISLKCLLSKGTSLSVCSSFAFQPLENARGNVGSVSSVSPLSSDVSVLTGSKAVTQRHFLFSHEKESEPFDVSFSDDIWCGKHIDVVWISFCSEKIAKLEMINFYSTQTGVEVNSQK